MLSDASPVDATLLPGERDNLLNEVRAQLPLWLQRAARPAPHPSGQVADLLGLDPGGIRRARAVHLVLSDPVEAFVSALPAALRAPQPTTDRPIERSPLVRGPVDWAATGRLQ